MRSPPASPLPTPAAERRPDAAGARWVRRPPRAPAAPPAGTPSRSAPSLPARRARPAPAVPRGPPPSPWQRGTPGGGGRGHFLPPAPRRLLPRCPPGGAVAAAAAGSAPCPPAEVSGCAALGTERKDKTVAFSQSPSSPVGPPRAEAPVRSRTPTHTPRGDRPQLWNPGQGRVIGLCSVILRDLTRSKAWVCQGTRAGSPSPDSRRGNRPPLQQCYVLSSYTRPSSSLHHPQVLRQPPWSPEDRHAHGIFFNPNAGQYFFSVGVTALFTTLRKRRV